VQRNQPQKGQSIEKGLTQSKTAQKSEANNFPSMCKEMNHKKGQV
jgi:hypothetical protein